MAIYRITAVLLATVIVVYSCASKSRKRVTDIRPNGYYSTKVPEVKHNCINVKRQFVVTEGHRYSESPNSVSCTNLSPGLASVQKGYIRSYETRHNNPMENAIEFSCIQNKTWRGYELPDQVEATAAVDRITILQQKLTSSQLFDGHNGNEVDGDVISLPWLSFAKSLELASDYIEVIVYEYGVKIKDAKPTRSVKLHYRHLQDEIDENYLEYFSFIKRFGTDVVKSCTLGGRYWLKIDKKKINVSQLEKNLVSQDIQLLLNTISAYVESSADSSIVGAYGGDFSKINNLTAWMNSVKSYPIPITCSYVPINVFIHPVLTEKYRSMQTIIDFENMNQHVRNVDLQLRVAKAETIKLGLFLRSMIHTKSSLLCPTEINYVLKDGLQKNYYVQHYFFTCKHVLDYDYEYENTVVERTYFFFLIPDICFTKIDQVTPTCLDARFSLPPNVKCVQFFETSECNGNSSVDVYSSRTIEAAFSLAKSFKFCNN